MRGPVAGERAAAAISESTLGAGRRCAGANPPSGAAAIDPPAFSAGTAPPQEGQADDGHAAVRDSAPSPPRPFRRWRRSCEHLPPPASRKGYSGAIPKVRCRAALPPSGRNAVLRPPGSRKAQAGSTGPGPAASVRYLTRPSSWQQQNPHAPVRRTHWRPSARIRRVPLPVPSAYRTSCARNSRKARSSRRRTSQ